MQAGRVSANFETYRNLPEGWVPERKSSGVAKQPIGENDSNTPNRTLMSRFKGWLRRHALIDNPQQTPLPVGNPSTLSTVTPNPSLSQRVKNFLGAAAIAVGSLLFCLLSIIFGDGNSPGMGTQGAGPMAQAVQQSADQLGRSLAP